MSTARKPTAALGRSLLRRLIDDGYTLWSEHGDLWMTPAPPDALRRSIEMHSAFVADAVRRACTGTDELIARLRKQTARAYPPSQE